jgi:hypothetical protein
MFLHLAWCTGRLGVGQPYRFPDHVFDDDSPGFFVDHIQSFKLGPDEFDRVQALVWSARRPPGFGPHPRNEPPTDPLLCIQVTAIGAIAPQGRSCLLDGVAPLIRVGICLEQNFDTTRKQLIRLYYEQRCGLGGQARREFDIACYLQNGSLLDV